MQLDGAGHSEPESMAYYRDPASGVRGVWIMSPTRRYRAMPWLFSSWIQTATRLATGRKSAPVVHLRSS